MTRETEREKHWPRHAFNAALGWYLVMMAFHGPTLGATALIQALGLSLLVGTLLTGNAIGRSPLRRRQVARFYLIPFCVSSFTAATAPAEFVVIFSPSLLENALAALLATALLLRLDRLPPFWFLLAVIAQFALVWHVPGGTAPGLPQPARLVAFASAASASFSPPPNASGNGAPHHPLSGAHALHHRRGLPLFPQSPLPGRSDHAPRPCGTPRGMAGPAADPCFCNRYPTAVHSAGRTPAPTAFRWGLRELFSQGPRWV